MTGDLLPASALLHPDAREAEMFGFAGIRHLPAPPVIRVDHQETGLHHPQNLLLVHEPEFPIGYIQLAQAYVQLGSSDLALNALNLAGRFSSNSKLISLRGFLFAKLGRTAEAGSVLNTLEAVARERYIPPYSTALVHAALGHADEAFNWLERAYDARDVHLIFLPVHLKWDALRADPRFLALLDRCRFPHLNS